MLIGRGLSPVSVIDFLLYIIGWRGCSCPITFFSPRARGPSSFRRTTASAWWAVVLILVTVLSVTFAVAVSLPFTITIDPVSSTTTATTRATRAFPVTAGRGRTSFRTPDRGRRVLSPLEHKFDKHYLLIGDAAYTHLDTQTSTLNVTTVPTPEDKKCVKCRLHERV